ncbi:THAP domain-containing protein 9, partial [Stegodyphus mimosarum]
MDPCHMLKLVRNCLASKGSIVDCDSGFILWEHITNLEKFQKEQGLHAATKLRARHIEWYREKMKVKLAAQVLSNSVADALLYLENDLKHPTFIGCAPTIKFLKIFNNLFDILNSKNLLSKDFKSPIKPQNKDTILNFLNTAQEYIKNLRTSKNGDYILHSNRKTGFLEFLVCINSIKSLYIELCEISPNPLNFFLTYKLSQDHLELFFSAIRTKGGHNNNPTAKQFKAAYVRLLMHHHIMTSGSANCIVLDDTNILNVSSSTNIYLKSINFNSTDTFKGDFDFSENCVTEDHSFALTSCKQFSDFVSDVVVYIAGSVVKKLKNALKCHTCIYSLSEVVLTVDYTQNKLVVRKNRGGLTVPSASVVKICRAAEKSFRTTQVSGKLKQKNIMASLISDSVKCVIENSPNIFLGMHEHILNHDPLDNHRSSLIKAILFEYLKIRLYHAGKVETEKLQNKKLMHENDLVKQE